MRRATAAPIWQLPQEVIPPCRPGATRQSLVVGVAVVALLNCALIGRIDNTTFQTIRSKWRLMEQTTQPVGGLVLSDSTGLLGVRPLQLGRELGEAPWLNLATCKNLLLVHQAWQLQWYLQHVGPPQSVLVVISPTTLSQEANASTCQLAAQAPQPWGYWKRMEPPLEIAEAGFPRMALSRYGPLWTQRTSLDRVLEWPVRAAVAWMARRPPPGPPLGPPRQIAPEDIPEVALGFEPAPPQQSAALARELARWQSIPPFKLTDLNARALRAMADWAERTPFELYLARGSMLRETAGTAKGRAHAEGAERCFREVSAGRRHVHYLPELPAYPADWMSDMDHVRPAAAKQWTSRLASQIRATRLAEPAQP
ncbi:MAG: hypothetical protein HUU35_06870 [Armatimonadetes bacterium]|nr:hypothetical protein [Armatimonadota bacterium]